MMVFLEPLFFMKLMCLGFLSVLFLQSGFDKVFHYKDNKEWLTAHFEKSLLNSVSGILLPAITVLEISAGLLSIIGLCTLIFFGKTDWGILGAQVSTLSVLALILGQRLAKDYEGASTLVGYFMMCIGSVYILQL